MSASTRWLGLVAWLGICLGVGGLGAVATTPEIDGWYRTLEKPTWNPPDRVFGPVWTTLYALMAIAAWTVWQRDGFRGARRALTWFLVQLLLNLAWSWIFFALHAPGWAFVEILVLWTAIVVTTLEFAAHSSPAAWLLAPYLAWVSFAGILNFAIWRLNTG